MSARVLSDQLTCVERCRVAPLARCVPRPSCHSRQLCRACSPVRTCATRASSSCGAAKADDVMRRVLLMTACVLCTALAPAPCCCCVLCCGELLLAAVCSMLKNQEARLDVLIPARTRAHARTRTRCAAATMDGIATCLQTLSIQSASELDASVTQVTLPQWRPRSLCAITTRALVVGSNQRRAEIGGTNEEHGGGRCWDRAWRRCGGCV